MKTKVIPKLAKSAVNIFVSERDSFVKMPTNRNVEDDDPEMKRFLEGGGLDPDTVKGRV